MEERITRGKAIRLKCLDCCCGSSTEVRKCPAEDCPLWRYRMGNEKKAQGANFAEKKSGGLCSTTPEYKAKITHGTQPWRRYT